MTHKLTRRIFLKQTGVVGVALGSGLLSRAAEDDDVLKVGVVHSSPLAHVEIGWAKTHYDAGEAIKTTFGDKVSLTRVDQIVLPQDAERVFRELASTGYKLIFGTSFGHGPPMHKVAPRFPDVHFEHCSGVVQLDNLATFQAKYHEAAYVCGVAAGHMTKSKKIGFVGGFAIPDVLSCANSLLLGAQSVRPDTTGNMVYLNSWFDPGKEKEAATALIALGCDVICPIVDTGAAIQVAGEKGVWAIGYCSDMSVFSPERHLTAYTLDWSSIYVQAVRDTLAGTWKAQERFDGLKEGVVLVSPYNSAIPADVQSLLKQAEADIESGALHPFTGEIKDQKGKVRVAKGEVMPDKEILGLDWYVEGMTGQLG